MNGVPVMGYGLAVTGYGGRLRRCRRFSGALLRVNAALPQ